MEDLTVADDVRQMDIISWSCSEGQVEILCWSGITAEEVFMWKRMSEKLIYNIVHTFHTFDIYMCVLWSVLLTNPRTDA